MSEDIATRLEACRTSVVFNAMRRLEQTNFILPSRLRPNLPDRVLAGPAFTVLGKVDPKAEPHETALAWTELLSRCPPGHVWVAQPNDGEVAHMGELSAETLRDKGVRGVVTDGKIRETALLIEIGFPCWATGATPRDVMGWWLPAAVNEQIRIGEVSIDPGDYIIADRDGVIRVPKALADDVIGMAEAEITTESAIRTAIRSGMDPQEAYLKFGRF